MNDILALLKKQKLAPVSVELKGGTRYLATFEGAQYDAVRRCQQRLYKQTLNGEAVDFWIVAFGFQVQQNTAYMVFEVNHDQK